MTALDDILRTRGEPIGHHDRHTAQATITWNTQGWILEAPPTTDGRQRKYLPCDECGKPMMVEMNVVSITCDGCLKSRED